MTMPQFCRTSGIFTVTKLPFASIPPYTSIVSPSLKTIAKSYFNKPEIYIIRVEFLIIKYTNCSSQRRIIELILYQLAGILRMESEGPG